MFSAILIAMLWKVAFVLVENVKNIFYIHFWTFFKKAIKVMLLKDSFFFYTSRAPPVLLGPVGVLHHRP